jgi:periplasmic protein CpxP/Spy
MRCFMRGWRAGVSKAWCLSAAAILLLQATTLSAQGGPPRGGRPDDPRRAELAQRFQERVESTIRQRLQLTDEQSAKLREVAGRTEEARRTLRREEMMARMALRRELLAGDNADQARVSDLLDQMQRVERRRLDLLDQEQRELARFLSPVQRARYLALQDELRRSMQEMQHRRMGADSARPPREGDRR